MRSLLLASAVLVACSGLGAQQPTGASTLLLLIEGDASRVTVRAAWRRAFPFASVGQRASSGGRVRLVGLHGRTLAEVPLDLTTFNLSGGGDVVTGDVIRVGRIHLLVKVPDLGAAVQRVVLERRVAGRLRRFGEVSGANLRRLLDRPPDLLANPVLKTHEKNGPVQNRYDIVILGDGYQASEINRFYSDVGNWITDLFNRLPYKTYRKFFNVHSVFRASKESGADHPDRNPPIYKDTSYDASYANGVGRCLYIKNQLRASQDAALAPDVEGRIVVFVNDSRYGGCAGKFAVSYNGPWATAVQSHEFGHAFGGVADEYGGDPSVYSGPEPTAPNVTADKNCAKWSRWKGYNGVGCFEGGRYHDRGIWRPKGSCLMRSLTAPLCEVCVEQLTKRCYQKVDPIENPDPASALVKIDKPLGRTFRFQDLTPGAGLVRWFLDGKLVQDARLSFYVLSTAVVRAGRHTLKVEVQDPTFLVRKDPDKALLHTRAWTVDVVDPTLPDLKIISFLAPTSARSGQRVTLESVVANTGASDAGAFRVESFVSADSEVTDQDPYLGFATVASLAKNASIRIRRDVELPYYLDAGDLWIASWVDREDAVHENDKINNLALHKLKGLGAEGCPSRLESADPLTYPPLESTVSLGAGGVSSLILTAPCRANQFYLALWGCSGTSPGTPLPPYTLPLNLDGCTTLALAAPNGPFYAMFGRVPFLSHVYPTLVLPKGTGLAPFTAHFAVVFFAPDFSRVTGVTNAVKQNLVQ